MLTLQMSRVRDDQSHLEYLQCMFEFALNRKYIAENPAAGVKHFDERRERPSKRMLTVDEEQRIPAQHPRTFALRLFCSCKRVEERTARAFLCGGTRWTSRIP